MKIEEFKNILTSLEKFYQKLIIDYGFSDVLSYLNKKTTNEIYPYKLPLLEDKFGQLFQNNDKSTFEQIRKIIFLQCLINSWDDIFSQKYPQSIQEQYLKNMKRFKKLCENEQGWGTYDNDDVYWKDLSLVRQQMFPVTSGVVEAFSGFGYRLGMRGGLFQAIKFLLLFFNAGGKKGFFQIHTHSPLIENFDKEGWLQSYIQLSEMMKNKKYIKGVFRASWLCDPKILRISPHLKYIQEIPLTNGAKQFYSNEDSSGNAFSKSNTRKTLYNEGKYTPKIYFIIWPRKEFLAWADSL